MTPNQIAYWNLQETKRHNAAVEQETNRSNTAQEAETSRKNREQERLQEAAQSETVRHNLASEQNDISKLSETVRHNLAVEAETKRDNLLTSSIKASQAATQERDSITKAQHLQLEKEKFQFDKEFGVVNTGIKVVDIGLNTFTKLLRQVK